MEEVGLQVKNITYYKSQPWSFSDTLLLGFFCELDGEDKITLDQEELALAQWFEREDIPVKEDDLSLTNEMMIAFKEWQEIREIYENPLLLPGYGVILNNSYIKEIGRRVNAKVHSSLLIRRKFICQKEKFTNRRQKRF